MRPVHNYLPAERGSFRNIKKSDNKIVFIVLGFLITASGIGIGIGLAFSTPGNIIMGAAAVLGVFFCIYPSAKTSLISSSNQRKQKKEKPHLTIGLPKDSQIREERKEEKALSPISEKKEDQSTPVRDSDEKIPEERVHGASKTSDSPNQGKQKKEKRHLTISVPKDSQIRKEEKALSPICEENEDQSRPVRVSEEKIPEEGVHRASKTSDSSSSESDEETTSSGSKEVHNAQQFPPEYKKYHLKGVKGCKINRFCHFDPKKTLFQTEKEFEMDNLRPDLQPGENIEDLYNKQTQHFCICSSQGTILDGSRILDTMNPIFIKFGNRPTT